MKRILDFKGLNQTLLDRINYLLPEWLPGGKAQGSEYVCGDLSGGPGKSTSINLSTGKWADFATEQSGGDLISLYAVIKNISQKDSFYNLREQYGTPESPRRKPMEQPTKIIKPKRNHKIPYDQNKYESSYAYRDKQGDILFYITRTPSKKFTPWCFTTDNTWINKHWPSPRPLFNLNVIHEFSDSPVLIVEGEKAALAAQQMAKSPYVVTTWPCGSNSWNKVDWTPLFGRRILIWPDADEPGRKAAKNIADHLLPNCPEVKIIDTTSFNGGKDAADFGFTNMAEFRQWATPLASIYKPEPEPVQEIIPASKPQPRPIPPISETQNKPERDPSIPDALVSLWEKLGLTCGKGGGRPHNSATNIVKALTHHKYLKHHIWYDEFHMKVFTSWRVKTPRPLVDQDYINLFIWLQDTLGIPNLTKQNVIDAVAYIAHQDTRNEPKDWLESLSWDQTPRLSGFFSTYFGAHDSEYSRAVSRNFMISIIARLFKPGCKVDTMVILEGKQGLYKSTALQVLGDKFYTISNNDMSRNDFFQSMGGFFLIELSELDAMNKAEATRIKTVLSTATDNYRAPYARHPETHERQSVLVGTTNELNYLKDTTGGRRFWPIECRTIDLDLLKQDREQLFAEALHAFKQGESWWSVPASALEEQEKRREQDPWEELIAEYLSGREFVTTMDILVKCIGMDADRVNTVSSRRVGKIMRIFGCVAGYKRVHGVNKYGFYTPESLSQQVLSRSQEHSSRSLPNFAPQ